MADDLELPSLDILLEQAASERQALNAHAESLDTKAGVVLGFAGVLVGLGATAQAELSVRVAFQAGLSVGVLAALLAPWAFLPRRYPVLEAYQLRQRFLTAPPTETRLHLLDTQIEMVKEAADLVKRKGRRVRASVAGLAIAAPRSRRYTRDDRREISWLTIRRHRVPQPILRPLLSSGRSRRLTARTKS